MIGPIMVHACKNGQIGVVEKLLKLDFYKAIFNDVDLKTFGELLNHGSNIEIKDFNNNSPLHFAYIHYKIEFVKELLKYGANPNHQMNDGNGSTLLHIACFERNISLTKTLLEHGADVNALDDDKQTPLHRAIVVQNLDDGKIEVIKHLLRNGANVNLKEYEGYTPIHEAALDKNMPQDLFIDLLKQCTDINVNNFKGQTPLHMAISEVCQSNVKTLLRCGADANLRDFEGYSSFEDSLACDQMSTFKLLIYNN